ncbi:unnamed protein product [Brassica oleracea var. botrytis]|uniref:Dof-type domain-containing protein n=1 Tax=Brassica oleracea TaxID=3712 RepID=A0A3P6EE12_BRAOL|nr:unnamed protein product [Brassica oleracea]
MDEEKPPPQSLSQPRYTCKNCRRLLTHGGTLRNISTGGSGRKTNCPRIDQPSVPQVVPVETQQVNHHQPFRDQEETNDFLGSTGGSSSPTVTTIVGNLVGSSDLLPCKSRVSKQAKTELQQHHGHES